jgi:hypothetical protein
MAVLRFAGIFSGVGAAFSPAKVFYAVPPRLLGTAELAPQFDMGTHTVCVPISTSVKTAMDPRNKTFS